ncbi:hypothetical protein LSM04_005504 [Trypanosoma melophagium]|uniref:uncharacterized protein n=1 Tax=Trypanosoma melophagium TaxID=715481 RepID=UPI003519EB40|nr:hypothetical protein LSM04_005504 [Trypanosoma melophagium]
MSVSQIVTNFFQVLLGEPLNMVSFVFVGVVLSLLMVLVQYKFSQRCGVNNRNNTYDDNNNDTLKDNSSSASLLEKRQGKKNNEHENDEKSKTKENTLAAGSTGEGRSKQEKKIEPTSVIRGFPEVDALILSPCQRFLFINCRSKRRARLYPQNSNRAFMSRGKELQEKYFVSVDDAVMHATGDDGKVEVRSAAFSYDGSRFVVGERNNDSFFVFSIGNNCQLTLQTSCKLPGRRLVSSLPPWGVAGENSELIVMLHEKDCEVEVFNLHTAVFLGKKKFKVGNALAWAQQDTTIAVGGSFLKEARVATLQILSDRNEFNLNNSVHVESDIKLRVSTIALTSKNVPSFNTCEYLLVLTEDGCCKIYNIESNTVNAKVERLPTLVGEFMDSTFAGWDSESPVQMTVCIYGSSHHERLAVALSRGGDVVVYRQLTPKTTKTTSSSNALFTLGSVMQLHDCHEGDRVDRVVFIQNGEGLATSGGADGRHVRLWTLPPISN